MLYDYLNMAIVENLASYFSELYFTENQKLKTKNSYTVYNYFSPTPTPDSVWRVWIVRLLVGVTPALLAWFQVGEMEVSDKPHPLIKSIKLTTSFM